MFEKPILPINFIHEMLVDLFFDSVHLRPNKSLEYLDAAGVFFNHALWFARLAIEAEENGGKISPEHNQVLLDKVAAALRAMQAMGLVD